MTSPDLIEDQVNRFLVAFSEVGSSDDDVTKNLVSSGIPLVDAEKLLALVPLAFGRILVSHMGRATFSQSAVLETTLGEPKSIDLRLEPIFSHALQVGTAMYHNGPRHLFVPAAGASAEVNCVDRLLHGGGRADDLVFTEPRFLRLTYEQWTRGR